MILLLSSNIFLYAIRINLEICHSVLYGLQYLLLSIQSGVVNFQIDPNSIQKNSYCSKLILLQSFYCLGGNILLTRGHLLDDCYIYLFCYPNALMTLFMYLLLNCSSYIFLSIKLLSLMSSEICKRCREY